MHPTQGGTEHSGSMDQRHARNHHLLLILGEARRLGAAAHLGLVDALDGDAVPGGAVGGGEGVAELAVAEQTTDLVARLEVPLVAELDPHGDSRRGGFRRGSGGAAPPLAVVVLGRAAVVGGAGGGSGGGGGEAGAHGRSPGSGGRG